MQNIKYFEHQIGLQFNDSMFVFKKMLNYVNAYIVYGLDNWSRNPLNNFTLKNCLVGGAIIVKTTDN